MKKFKPQKIDQKPLSTLLDRIEGHALTEADHLHVANLMRLRIELSKAAEDESMTEERFNDLFGLKLDYIRNLVDQEFSNENLGMELGNESS